MVSLFHGSKRCLANPCARKPPSRTTQTCGQNPDLLPNALLGCSRLEPRQKRGDRPLSELSKDDHPSARLRSYRKYVRNEIIEAGNGILRLTPNGLWLYISENCNLRCIGCYTGPGQFKKSYMSLDTAKRVLASAASYSYIDITSGEGFLHPQLFEIIEICKSLHPTATVELVTNGTIPLRSKARQALEMIDGLGISIDGATKEMFEFIRQGSNFERFIANVKDIVAFRNETGKPTRLEFCFTALALNLADLPNVVRLAAQLGVPAVFFQPMELGEPEIEARIGPHDLRFVNEEDIFKVTDEAIALGKTLGVDVNGREFMIRGGEASQLAAAAIPSSYLHEEAISTCRALWTDHFRYVADDETYFIQPCCQMPIAAAKELSERFGLVFTEMESVDKVFNSEAYWDLRLAQADGEFLPFCGNCKHASSHSWIDLSTSTERDDS